VHAEFLQHREMQIGEGRGLEDALLPCAHSEGRSTREVYGQMVMIVAIAIADATSCKHQGAL
jgi:hypothetical protein